jgi:hypothetical protein
LICNREGDDHLLPERAVSYPVAKTTDGYWTVPYFDCGGGNVWMVTYVAPLLKEQNGYVVFQLVYFRSSLFKIVK